MEHEKIIDDFLKTEKGKKFIKNKLYPEIMGRIRKESAQKSLIDINDVVEIVSTALTGYKELEDVKESAKLAFREYYNKRAKEERNNLYNLYKKSLVKWEDIKKILEGIRLIAYNPGSYIYHKVNEACVFCYDATGDNRCDNCKIDKRICDNNSSKGFISYYNEIKWDYYNNSSIIPFRRKTLFLINIIIKALKWNMNNILLTCYHNWKFIEHCFCMECSEFYKAYKLKRGLYYKDDPTKIWFTHGNPVSQCIKCGLMYEPEYGYFNYDEIENFKFNETKIPHIENITIRGLWIIENIKNIKRLL